MMTEQMKLKPIAILGAGSWGTALAVHLASHGRQVHLWEFDQEQVSLMQKARCNERYLPDISFPDTLALFDELSSAVKDVQDLLLAVPSHAFRQTLQTVQLFLRQDARIAWATKGIDPITHQLLADVVRDVLGDRALAILSGPSFAKEVGAGLPTAVVVAANDEAFSTDLVQLFNCGQFRVYTSNDMIGVQLGGAVKNVIALAAGACDGLGFGANARCGLITRGLAEIMRLGLAMGAQQETFMGLSGLGDLVLTCTDNQSRNRRFGLAIGRGCDRETAEKEIGQVVEGAHTADQLMALAEQYQVEMPICNAVWRVLHDELSPKEAVIELLARSPKPEM